MKRNIYKVAFGALTALFINTSCTDLSETVYHEMLADDYYNNRLEVLSGVTRPYTHMRHWHTPNQDVYYQTSELSADQLAWPQKGQHGLDGHKWVRLHYHTWHNREDGIGTMWNSMFTGIGYCNNALENLEKRSASAMGLSEDEKNTFIAELRMLRAYHHMKLMDAFGNIPIVPQVGGQLNPPNRDRKDVFEWVEKEYLEWVEKLEPLKKETIGRVAKGAGYGMLAELYLNAEKWSGTARWDDCITYANKVLNGEGGSQHGTLAFDEDITLPFCNVNGERSNENVFVIAYDYSSTDRFCTWQGIFYSFNHGQIYGGHTGGNNGIVVIPSAYEKFSEKDKRHKEWLLIGPQYKYGTDEPVLATEEYSGQQMVFVPYIRRESQGKTESTMLDGEENSGARMNKFNPGPQTDKSTYWNNDWVIYRLTDFHFMKAEALMRKNGGTATPEAVELINARLKYCYEPEDWDEFLYTTATLTMDALLDERGREFIFEGKRRTDLIRFGKFVTASWWDHIPSNDPNKELFPIPYDPLSVNPNLEQNPGYTRE